MIILRGTRICLKRKAQKQTEQGEDKKKKPRLRNYWGQIRRKVKPGLKDNRGKAGKMEEENKPDIKATGEDKREGKHG